MKPILRDGRHMFIVYDKEAAQNCMATVAKDLWKCPAQRLQIEAGMKRLKLRKGKKRSAPTGEEQPLDLLAAIRPFE